MTEKTISTAVNIYSSFFISLIKSTDATKINNSSSLFRPMNAPEGITAKNRDKISKIT
jgi:hypothetical protein